MSKNFKIFLTSIFMITIAYFIVTIISFFLPTSGVEKYKKKDNYTKTKYYILNSFTTKTKRYKQTIKNQFKRELIKDIKLKTIFAFNNAKGFVILEDRAKKTYILENGQKYKRYKLIKVYATYAIFEKNNKTYQINIDKNSILKDSMKVEDSDFKGGELRITVDKKEITKRIKDASKIWKEVSIDAVKENNIVTGFKIKNVKSSFFRSLGIKKNDIITRINDFDASNNEELFKLYSNISKLKKVKIRVNRNGRDIDLVYKVK